VASIGSLTALFDFVYLVSSATWVESVERLDELLPPSGWLDRFLPRWAAQML